MSGPVNDALNDELEALTSIYDCPVLTILPASSNNTTSNSADLTSECTSAILALPGVAYTFSTLFPPDYPDSPPKILGTHHVDATVKKGQGDVATAILRDVLSRVYAPGQVCLFDLFEEAMPLLMQQHEEQQGAEDDRNHGKSNSDRASASASAAMDTSANFQPTEDYHSQLSTSQYDTGTKPAATKPAVLEPRWVLSEQLIVSKSTFIARCLRVASLVEAQSSIAHLLATNKRVATATHNITAWRIRQAPTSPGGPEITIQDCDDDGETAAGGRLLHLLQLMDVWNVVVVVTRWYGGVKLGPDRFRCINAVAREAVVNLGLAGGAGAGEKSANVKKGKKS